MQPGGSDAAAELPKAVDDLLELDDPLEATLEED